MDCSLEQELKILFGYQNYENNSELAKMKAQSEYRFAHELKEDELSLVNAAGEFEMPGGTITNNKKGKEDN